MTDLPPDFPRDADFSPAPDPAPVGELPETESPAREAPAAITLLQAARPATESPWQYYPRPQYRRRVALPIVLFILTCLSTFWAGVCHGSPETVFASILAGPRAIGELFALGWLDGLIYMSAVMGILLAHELGHFVQAVRNGVPASFPMFIPMPIGPLGTMGAVIAMQGASADRRQLFDIGLTGPLAGLAVAIPIAWIGIARAVPAPFIINPLLPFETIVFENPLLMQAMIEVLHPGIQGDQIFQFDPLMRAAWVGMLVTGLNMLPVSQLDGGHVAYALLGRRSKYLAYGVIGAGIGFMAYYRELTWLLMLVIIILIGVVHRPTADDTVPLGRARRVIGFISLTIPIFCFHPYAIRVIG